MADRRSLGAAARELEARLARVRASLAVARAAVQAFEAEERALMDTYDLVKPKARVRVPRQSESLLPESES
jgi:uncharacterized protein involved in exopolysaccharide biosynthesis